MHRVPTQWDTVHGKQLIVKLKPSLTHACSNTINEWLLGWRASFAGWGGRLACVASPLGSRCTISSSPPSSCTRMPIGASPLTMSVSTSGLPLACWDGVLLKLGVR